jgi:translation initiation factor IF-2
MVGLLEPIITEILVGEAEVREIFTIPKVGLIFGCYMKDGKVLYGAIARVMREGKEIIASKVTSLKRFKEDAKEVLAGYECGIGLEQDGDLQKGDTIQFYKIEETAAGDGK